MRSTRRQIISKVKKERLKLGTALIAGLFAFSLSGPAMLAQSASVDQQRDQSEGQSEGQASKASGPAEKPTERELTTEDVIGKAISAYGGNSALRQMEKNASFFGQRKDLTASTASVSYRQLQKSSRWRIDIDLVNKGKSASTDDAPATDGVTKKAATVYAFDGVVPWVSSGRITTEMSAGDYDSFSAQVLKQPFILSHFLQNGYKFVFKGRTQYRQTPVFAVEVKINGQKGLTTIYLDQSNYLMVAAVTSFDEVPGQADAGKNVGVEFSEYRPVGGSLWPFKQIVLANGTETAEYDLTSVDLTSDILESAFNRPDSGPAVRLSHDVVVPFDYSQREILVKCRINGGDELEFLFDTGASETLIDRRVAAECFLPKQGEFDIAAASGMVTTRTSMLKRLEVGKLIVNDLPVRIIDLSSQSKHLGRSISGIIGTNLIGKFFTTIDYSKPSITFGDLETSVRPPNAVPLNFAMNASPFVTASLNGRDPQVLLMDTGAAFNHLPYSVAKKYSSADPAAMKHSTEGTGLDGVPVRLGMLTLDSVSVNGFSVKKVTFTYPQQEHVPIDSAATRAKTTTTRSGFFKGSNLGILGNPFWQNFIVSIDWKYQRLLIQNNPIFKVRDEIERALNAADSALVLHRDYRLAEGAYQRAMMVADSSGDIKAQAKLLGRMGNLRRLMAKDLGRPEHSKAAYDYFSRGVERAQKVKANDVEGRILADWSLLYSDNGQAPEAKQTIDRALLLAPDDANVNVDCAVELYRAGLFPEMQKYVEKALFLDPDNWQALWYQVKLCEQFGDTAKAISALKEITHYYPWSKLAQDKIKQLQAPPPPVSAPADATGASVPPASTPPPASPSQTKMFVHP
ncbi:MAG: aspartyl protease family protein [Candidatus Obscuribacterales bacterium]|nr:aspartyl protease family protein [Candidatus Obscuribacterales bacterium]